MPDPYGLAEFTDSLLPDDPTPEEVLEALHLWEVPEEAYPPCKNGVGECNYKLDRGFGEKANTIHVFLRRQAFVTHPAPYLPRNETFQPNSAFGKSHFSVGPLPNSP